MNESSLVSCVIDEELAHIEVYVQGYVRSWTTVSKLRKDIMVDVNDPEYEGNGIFLLSRAIIRNRIERVKRL